MTFAELMRGAHKLGISSLSFGVDDACVDMLVAAGALVSRLVIAPPGRPPYVVEKAVLRYGWLVARARRKPTPATPEDLRALDSDCAWFYAEEYKAVEIPPAH